MGLRHKLTQAADKVSTEFILKDEPGSSEKHMRSSVEEMLNATCTWHPMRFIPDQLSGLPKQSFNTLAERLPLALQRGTRTRPRVAGRVAMGLHHSSGSIALGKPVLIHRWECGNWGASM